MVHITSRNKIVQLRVGLILCARSSDVISRRNQKWRRENVGFFLRLGRKKNRTPRKIYPFFLLIYLHQHDLGYLFSFQISSVQGRVCGLTDL